MDQTVYPLHATSEPDSDIIGYVRYGEETKLELDFTDNSATVSSKLAEISAEVGNVYTTNSRGLGGSYEPESGLEGVEKALSLSGYRDDASRQIIVISDATFHDAADTKGIEGLSPSPGIGTAPDD